LPKATRPGDAEQIHLHDPQGQAPELRKILEANGWDHLLIAFPLDDPRQFISQIFTRYSSTRLEAYGDEQQVTYIDNRKQTLEANGGQPLHRTFPAARPSTSAWSEAARRTPASTSAWPNGPRTARR
jgi:hypothetical protein